MMIEFFGDLYEFKYSEGSLVDKFKELENLFCYFSHPNLTEDEEVLACHLIFDASDHMVRSRHSRQFEYAGEWHERIENQCRNLITKTTLDIKESLYIITEMHRRGDISEMRELNKFISSRSPWDFYLVEGVELVPELRIFTKEFGQFEMCSEINLRFIRDRKTGKLDHNGVSNVVAHNRKRMRVKPDT